MEEEIKDFREKNDLKGKRVEKWVMVGSPS